MNDELIKLKYDFFVQCHFELEKKHQIILVNMKEYVQRIQYGLLLLHGAGVTILSSFILKVYEIHQTDKLELLYLSAILFSLGAVISIFIILCQWIAEIIKERHFDDLLYLSQTKLELMRYEDFSISINQTEKRENLTERIEALYKEITTEENKLSKSTRALFKWNKFIILLTGTSLVIFLMSIVQIIFYASITLFK